MPRKDPELERWKRLSWPPKQELRDARRKGVAEAEEVMDTWVRTVKAEGDDALLHNAYFEYVRCYFDLWVSGHQTPEVANKLRRAVEEMERFKPDSAQTPIYAARMVYHATADKEMALRLARTGLEIARHEEDNPEAPPPRYPYHAMALRVELAILADTDPTCRRVAEILEELAGQENVGTFHDHEREQTTERLLAAGVRSEALLQLLLRDRRAYGRPRRNDPRRQSIEQIGRWLAMW